MRSRGVWFEVFATLLGVSIGACDRAEATKITPHVEDGSTVDSSPIVAIVVAPPEPAAAKLDVTAAQTIAGDDRNLPGLAVAVRPCASAGLLQDPTTTAGTVVISVTIKPTGEVEHTHQASNSGLPFNSVACMQLHILDTQFSPSPATRTLTITVKQSKP